MVKEQFNEFFSEYLTHHRDWSRTQWREFTNRFMLNGFIHLNETKNILRTQEGYKEYFDEIFLNADKIVEMQTLTEEELLQSSRLNIHLSEKGKSNRRQLFDFLFAIIAGIVSYFYFDWKWLLIIVSIYAFIKASVVFSILEKTDAMHRMSQQELTELQQLDTENRKKTIEGHRKGYAISQGCFQFILSMIILSGFALIARFLTSSIF